MPPIVGSRPRSVWVCRSRQRKYDRFILLNLFCSCFLSYGNPVAFGNAGYTFAQPTVVRPHWFQCNRFFCSITSSRKVLMVASSQLARSVLICCHVENVWFDLYSIQQKCSSCKRYKQESQGVRNGDVPWQNAWCILSGDCSAWLQVKSMTKWTTLTVWTALSSSCQHDHEIAVERVIVQMRALQCEKQNKTPCKQCTR